MPLFITVAEAARLLSCTPMTIHRAIERGALPVVRPFGSQSLRIRVTDLERLGQPASAPRS